ncbi:MAG: ABC transporter permease, partial [Bacteroidetes bacterium]|nr:ABC transporter permease [Bacteroidota bacterium]
MNSYTFHITLYDLIIFGMIFTGWVFCLFLWFVKSINRSANRFLALALLAMTLWMLRILHINLPAQMLLAVGPLLYFYVLKITQREHKFKWKDLLHLSPLAFVVAPAPVLQILIFTSVMSYLYLAGRLIQKFYKGLQPVLMDRSLLEFRWLRRLLGATALLWVLWILSELGLPVYGSVYIFFAVMIIWTAAAAFLRPQAGTIKAIPVIQKTVPSEVRQKSIWLKKMMESDHYYSDPELSLSSLAEQLGLTTHELSQIVNTGLKKSFADFVNAYRVRDAAAKMQDPEFDHLTLLGIAYESGFNSQRTFNRAFKDVTGRTPLGYKNDLKKVLPYDKMAKLPASSPVILRQLKRNFMFRNYLKIAWRNMLRQRLYALINISGLAVGLAVCMLIMLYVAHEHSYDRFHKNADRIIKPYGEMKINGNTFDMDQMSYASGPIIKQSLPIVEDYMRTLTYFQSVVINNPAKADRKFAESKLLFADPGFFNFFSFKLLSGQPSQVLSRPFSVVLSLDMAKKYFGDENPVGKTLVIKTDSAYTYQVTGVAENCPSNSTIEYNFVASNSGFVKTKEARVFVGDEQKLSNGTFDVYLLLRHLSDTAALRQGLQSLIPNKKDDAGVKFSLAPLVDRHLNRARDISNIKYLTIFPLVALLILLLALVNYMSLSTARATLRAKEIGVRKISGASRKSVALQFYMESAVFSTIAFLLGYVLCYLFKPVFFNVLQLKIDNSFLYSPLVLFLLFALLLVTVLVSGSYPSLVLSGFKPVVTLKGKMGKQSGGVAVRKVFTTLQFAISVGLIICGIVIDRQLYFFRHTDTGVDRENVVMIPVGSTFKNYPAFNHEIRTLAGVSGVSTSRYGMFSYYDMIGIPGKTKDETIMLPSLAVDADFFRLLGLKWKYPP